MQTNGPSKITNNFERFMLFHTLTPTNPDFFHQKVLFILKRFWIKNFCDKLLRGGGKTLKLSFLLL